MLHHTALLALQALGWRHAALHSAVGTAGPGLAAMLHTQRCWHYSPGLGNAALHSAAGTTGPGLGNAALHTLLALQAGLGGMLHYTASHEPSGPQHISAVLNCSSHHYFKLTKKSTFGS
jgi:hypothetical protein